MAKIIATIDTKGVVTFEGQGFEKRTCTKFMDSYIAAVGQKVVSETFHEPEQGETETDREAVCQPSA